MDCLALRRATFGALALLAACAPAGPASVITMPRGWQGDRLRVLVPAAALHGVARDPDAPDHGPIREGVRDDLIDAEDRTKLFECPGAFHDSVELLFRVNEDGSAAVSCVAPDSHCRGNADRPASGFAIRCIYVAADIGGWCSYEEIPPGERSPGCRCLAERLATVRFDAPPATAVLASFSRGSRDPYDQHRARRFR